LEPEPEPDPHHVTALAPASPNDAAPCGSGSATLIITNINLSMKLRSSQECHYFYSVPVFLSCILKNMSARKAIFADTGASIFYLTIKMHHMLHKFTYEKGFEILLKEIRQKN
jgi:hypothetical protein